MVVGYISLRFGLVIVSIDVVKDDFFLNKSIKTHNWTASGLEPGISCTQRMNHTSRPSGHFLVEASKHSLTYTYPTFFSTLGNPTKTVQIDTGIQTLKLQG